MVAQRLVTTPIMTLKMAMGRGAGGVVILDSNSNFHRLLALTDLLGSSKPRVSAVGLLGLGLDLGLSRWSGKGFRCSWWTWTKGATPALPSSRWNMRRWVKTRVKRR